MIKAHLIRAGWTFSETMLSLVGVDTAFNCLDLKKIILVSALSAAISLLKSMAVGVPEIERIDEVRETKKDGDIK